VLSRTVTKRTRMRSATRQPGRLRPIVGRPQFHDRALSRLVLLKKPVDRAKAKAGQRQTKCRPAMRKRATIHKRHSPVQQGQVLRLQVGQVGQRQNPVPPAARAKKSVSITRRLSRFSQGRQTRLRKPSRRTLLVAAFHPAKLLASATHWAGGSKNYQCQ